VTVPREALRTRLQAFIEMLQEQGGASSARQAESALAAAQTT
jgi:hypothetical protein